MKKATSPRHKKIKGILVATFFFSAISAPAATILVDFGVAGAGEMPADNGGTYWNNIPQGTTNGNNLNLRSSSTNETTGIILNLTSDFVAMLYQSTGTTTPTTPISAFNFNNLGYDTWQTLEGHPLVFTLTGLSNAYTYQFTMFASVMSADGNNRNSNYTLAGATTQTVSLNALNNTSNVVSTDFLSPGASGNFTFSCDLGAGNTNTWFSYLGGLQIEYNAVPEPSTWALLSVGFGLLIFFHRRRKA